MMRVGEGLVVDRASYDDSGVKIRPCRRRISLGSRNRRILKTVIIGRWEYSYHATKGWRGRREVL